MSSIHFHQQSERYGIYYTTPSLSKENQNVLLNGKHMLLKRGSSLV